MIKTIETALEYKGWSILKPVLPSGFMGPQIDSTDVAQVVADCLDTVLFNDIRKVVYDPYLDRIVRIQQIREILERVEFRINTNGH